MGPSVSWMVGDTKADGSMIPGSASQAVSIGAEFYFKIAPLSITLNYMADVYGENVPRGQLARLKLCFKL
jgi:hypothetical protein